jgi:hypothetical protein
MPLKSWATLLNDAGDAAAGFEVLPAADYDLRITKSEAKMSSTGKVMFAITTEVTNGPYKGRKLWGNIVVSSDNPIALGIFFRTMNAMGIDQSFFAGNPSDAQVAEAMIGREFRGQVSVRQWQGQDRNEIKSYFPIKATMAGGPAVAPPPTVVQQAANPQPSPGTPRVAPAPSPTPVAAAAAEPAPAPDLPPAPEPPAQPATPPVPDAAPDLPPAAAGSPVPDGLPKPPAPPF